MLDAASDREVDQDLSEVKGRCPFPHEALSRALGGGMVLSTLRNIGGKVRSIFGKSFSKPRWELSSDEAALESFELSVPLIEELWGDAVKWAKENDSYFALKSKDGSIRPSNVTSDMASTEAFKQVFNVFDFCTKGLCNKYSSKLRSKPVSARSDKEALFAKYAETLPWHHVSAGSLNPYSHLSSSLFSAVSNVFAMCEVLPAVFEQAMGREMTEEEYFNIVNSKDFHLMLMAFAKGHGARGAYLISGISDYQPIVEEGWQRPVFDPDFFEIGDLNGEQVFKFKPGVVEDVMGDFDQLKNVPKQARLGCPARVAKGVEGSLLREFIDFVSKAYAKKHFARASA